MATRRLNFTKRKRINREDVSISVEEIDGIPRMDAKIDLSEYAIPSGSGVFLEVHRQMQMMRFDLGAASNIVEKKALPLDQFDSSVALLFRVKVVLLDGDSRGLILAEADGIRPRFQEKVEASVLPLIEPVPCEHLGEELWRVSYEDERVELQLNSRLPDLPRFLASPEFKALVLPAVVRDVVWKLKSPNQDFDEDDINEWQTRWRLFIRGLPGIEMYPAFESLSNESDKEEWVNDVVAAFCTRHKFGSGYLAQTEAESR